MIDFRNYARWVRVTYLTVGYNFVKIYAPSLIEFNDAARLLDLQWIETRAFRDYLGGNLLYVIMPPSFPYLNILIQFTPEPNLRIARNSSPPPSRSNLSQRQCLCREFGCCQAAHSAVLHSFESVGPNSLQIQSPDL
jgi:hypothetical protein